MFRQYRSSVAASKPRLDDSAHVKRPEQEFSFHKKFLDMETTKTKSSERKLTDGCMQCIADSIEILNSWKTFDNSEVVGTLRRLDHIFLVYREERKAMGNRLAEQGFAELAVKVMDWFNNQPFNIDIWPPAYSIYEICANFSDASRELSLSLGSAGLVRICTLNIQNSQLRSKEQNENIIEWLDSNLTILFNLCKLHELKDYFEEDNVKDALKSFLRHENACLQATAIAILTTIISEEENAQLSDTGSIKFMVNGLAVALTRNEEKEFEGFSPVELVECLGRMAINDENKAKIVSLKALPMLVVMLQGNDEEEQLAAAKTLWTMAFDKTVREKIKIEPGCLETLEKLTGSSNPRVKKSAKGAIWTLTDNNGSKLNPKAETKGKEEGHIFISYCWSQQSEVLQIKNALKDAGYRVWIDMEQMGGSTLESMAGAVENATVVLICASADYKASPNCRTEAEYTFQLKKPIVPLLLQMKYKADGWLGMIMGSKLFINFAGKYPFETALAMLEKELKGQTNIQASLDSVESPNQGKLTLSKTISKVSKRKSAASWSKEEVGDWLEKFGLGSKKNAFAEYDGARLAKLLVIRDGAADFFYKFLQKEMHMDLLEICSLILALESLP